MLSAAFASLGFLVGNLTGLSASPIAKAVVPALGHSSPSYPKCPRKIAGLPRGQLCRFQSPVWSARTSASL
jgi:hypothetical protein